MNNNDERLLDSKDICEMLRISKTTLTSFVKRDHFPKPFKVGNKFMWKRSEIDTYLEQTRSKQQ